MKKIAFVMAVVFSTAICGCANAPAETLWQGDEKTSEMNSDLGSNEGESSEMQEIRQLGQNALDDYNRYKSGDLSLNVLKANCKVYYDLMDEVEIGDDASVGDKVYSNGIKTYTLSLAQGFDLEDSAKQLERVLGE